MNPEKDTAEFQGELGADPEFTDFEGDNKAKLLKVFENFGIPSEGLVDYNTLYQHLCAIVRSSTISYYRKDE